MTDKRQERIAAAKDFMRRLWEKQEPGTATSYECMADFSLEVEQKWVPVSKRLPSDNKEYLCRYRDDLDVDTGSGYTIDDMALRWPGTWLANYSHWMPIPPAPKEEV